MRREVPPETHLDGRPDQANLILHRTLREVREEKARDMRRHRRIAAVVTTTLLAAVLAGGVLIGQRLAADAEWVVVAGSPNGTSMTTTITPADGWLRVRAVVNGIHEGERCRLVVTDVTGGQYVAGGWVGSSRAETEGITLAGAAMVALERLGAVSVVTVDGRVLVTALV